MHTPPYNNYMPKVSVIIPTYNRSALIKQAIDSVFAQTYRDFELIVVDDGSTDSTQEIIASYLPETLSYYYQPNAGPSAARNLGIENARSSWIAFLDSDDYWLPKKLETHIAWCQTHTNILISQTDETWIRNGKRVNPMNKHKKRGGMIYERCLPLCCISPSSVMIHRSLLDAVGLFNESLPACEDYDLWLRIAYNHEVGFIPEQLTVKLGGHADQRSRTVPSLDKYRIDAMTNILERNVLSPEQKNATIKELQNKCAVYGEGCLKHGKHSEGKRYLSLRNKKW